MDNVSRSFLATPEGLLHLFLDAGVSVELLAIAFETDTRAIESTIREAMRKRDAIMRTMAPSTVELVHPVGDAA